MQEIAKNATTGGLYTQVGELYGFPIKVVSERILKEGLEFTDNRFVVEGNYKYTYNNGIWRWLTRWPPPATSSTRWRGYLHHRPVQGEERGAGDGDTAVTGDRVRCGKGDELKQLKSELAALDRKIQLDLRHPRPKSQKRRMKATAAGREDVGTGRRNIRKMPPPQIRSPADSIVANHVIMGVRDCMPRRETRSKGLKI